MIRSVEQYLESLRDGRVIYCLGERVRDVATHPVLRNVIHSAAMDYYFPNNPRYRDLFVSKNEDGEDVHSLFISPRSSEDLLRRREMFLTTWRTGGGTQLHCMGIDALEASRVVAERMDKQVGTNYLERVEAYRKYLQKADLGITGAMTDVKGDRSLRPSKQQGHQDYYVRVVDRQKNGIVVRGAKMHISSTPGANEAIFMPCRAHGEEDKDYALVFATPLNAKGIKIISGEPPMRETGEEAAWDYPVTTSYGHGTSECMIVLDDVFVPWERVFMCGEWQFSKDITNPHFQVGSIHGEGSLAAQSMFLYSGAHWGKYKGAAKKAAGIPGWEGDETYGSLPDYPACISSKMEPMDSSYKL
jgi:4-hydroxybutyryl-CoA dehydratase/vinylacetyl-CoA-Delta-isomerase